MIDKKEPPSTAAEKLAALVAQAAFDFWEDKEFRRMINFEKISKTEQDRIFNELEVTILGLVALHAEERPILIRMQQETVNTFIEIMAKLGIEEEYLDTWKLLIKMRFKEYKEDFRMALKESKKWEELKDEDKFRPVWARIETLTIDGLRHIKRGKVEKEDPLWKYLRKWLTMMEVLFEKVLEESLIKTPKGTC